MDNAFFSRYEVVFNRVCAFLGDGWRIDRCREDCYRIYLVNPAYRNYSISASLKKDRISLFGSVPKARRGNSYDSCTVSPLRDAAGIAQDIKRKILVNARKHIDHFDADLSGEKQRREERQIVTNLLSRLVDVQKYTGYYGGLCHIKTAQGNGGKVDEICSGNYRLEVCDLSTDQLIKLVGFLSTLER